MQERRSHDLDSLAGLPADGPTHDAPVPGLSVFIVAFNEAGRIRRGAGCRVRPRLRDRRRRLGLSTDTTVEIARAAGARVVVEPWRGYGPQKRFAEDQCTGPWLLNLDADEFVPPALAQEIRELFGVASRGTRPIGSRSSIDSPSLRAQAFRLRAKARPALSQGRRALS